MIIRGTKRARFRKVALVVAVTFAILTAPTWLRWFGIIGAIPSGMMWGGYEGIYVNEKSPAEAYPLRTKAGKYMYSPIFTIWRHGVVYWSRPDNAIRVIPAEGPSKWINMAGRFPAGVDIADIGNISPAPNGIVLNAGDASYRVALPAGKVSLIPDASEARSTEQSEDLVVMNARGNLELRHGSDRRVILRAPDTLGSWDYDFVNGRLCFVDGLQITLTGRDGSSSWRIWPWGLVAPIAVSVVPSTHQVWVLDAGAFGMGNDLLLYDYHGRLVANRVDAQDATAGLQMGMVDERTLRTLKRLDRVAPEEDGVES